MGGQSASLRLNDLVAGQWYQVQVWVNDSRASTAGRTERVNESAFLNYNPGGPSDNPAYEGNLGQHITGMFRATAASQRLDFVASASAQVNGLQVRTIPTPDPLVFDALQRRQFILNSFIDGKMSASARFASDQLLFASGQISKGKSQALYDSRWLMSNAYTFDTWEALDMVIRWKAFMSAETRNNIKYKLGKINYTSPGTANLTQLALTIRFLGSEEFGESAFSHPYDDWRTGDPNAHDWLIDHMQAMAKDGCSEFASNDYGWYNILPQLSLAQLSKDPSMRSAGAACYPALLAQLAPGWQRQGYIGAWSWRSYEDQSGYMMSLGRLLWGAFGGNARSGECQEMGMLAAMNYKMPEALLHAANDRTTAYTYRHHGGDCYQTAYVSGNDYTLFSATDVKPSTNGWSYGYGVRWTGMSNYFWLTKPLNDDPAVIDSAVNHGKNEMDFSTLQHEDTVLYSFDISKSPYYALSQVPGGWQALINESATSGRLFLHYGTVMISVASSIPFVSNTSSGIRSPRNTPKAGDWEFRVAYPNETSPSTTANRFAMAVETALPAQYPGASAADQLAAFRADIVAKTTITHENVSPTIAHYTNRHGDVLQKQCSSDTRYNKPGYINGVSVDYARWPMSESPWTTQAASSGPLTITGGKQKTVLNVDSWTVTNSVVPPTGAQAQISSDPAAGITETSAVFNGTLASSGSSATTVTLYWGTADGGTSAGGWQNSQALGVRTPGALSNSMSGLTKSTTTYYRYFASNSAGGVWSDSTVSFSTLATPPPGVPALPTTTLTIGSVPLTWTSVPGAVSYSVKRATTSGGPYGVLASGLTTTAYSDATVVPGTSYCYVISATGEGGESLDSGELLTIAAVAPAAPAGLSASMGYMYPTLSWSATPWAATYTVKRSTTSGGPYTEVATGITGTRFEDTTALNQTTYYYVVSASNVAGEGPDGTPASIAVNVLTSISTQSGGWSTYTWYPNPPGLPTSSMTGIIDFCNSSAIASDNDMGSFTVNQLRFLGQPVTLTGSPILLNGTNAKVSQLSSPSTIGNAITLNQNATFEVSADVLTISGPIGGGYSLIKTGSGTLALAGNNTYAGSTLLNGGTLAYTANNPNVKQLLFGSSANSTVGSALHVSANVACTSMILQTTYPATNSLEIDENASLTVNGAFTAGGLNGSYTRSHLTVAGAGTFTINNPSGTFSIRRGTILDLTNLQNTKFVSGNFNIGDIDNYTVGTGTALKVSTDGDTAIWANTINIDSATSGGGSTRGENATFMAGEGGGTLTIRNAAGTGASKIYMDKHAGSGTSATTTIFDARGHNADINLSALEISHRTGSVDTGDGTSSFYFGSGLLNVSSAVLMAMSDAGVAGNTAGLEISGGTVNFAGGITMGVSTTKAGANANATISDGDVTSGNITMTKVTSTGGVISNLKITGGILRMVGDIVRGAVTGTGNAVASVNLLGGTLDMGGRSMGVSGSIVSLNIQSGILKNVGAINGGTGFTKTGTGTLVLDGTNTYAGITYASAGTLVVAGSTVSPMTVQNAAILTNHGTINATVTVNAGGEVNRVGTINGDLVNSGYIEVTGDDPLLVSGTITNNGTLKMSTWNGTVPTNIINNGTLLPPDHTTPVLTLPADMKSVADNSGTAPVKFAVSAVDDQSGACEAVATPASGSAFPLGETTVTVSASDECGNVATRTFTVTVEAPVAPPVPGANLKLHLDASKPSTIVMDSNGKISRWNDADGGTNYASQTSAANQPGASVDAASGRSVVDFGSFVVGSTGQWMQFKGSTGANLDISTIRSVFVVMRGANFLLGDDNTFLFHRGGDNADGTSPLWDSAISSANIRNGQTYLNGGATAINGTTTSMPPGHWLASVITSGTVEASRLACDRTFRTGGQQMAELLIYDRALTESERKSTEAYLMLKWFGTDLTAPVITVPSNMTVEATRSDGAIVNFSTSATDNVDGPVSTLDNPASGSVFTFGVTTVTVTASDAAGNQASKTFNVTVTVPPIAAQETCAPKVEISDSNIHLTVTSTVPGRSYQLQYSNDLSSGSWTDFGPAQIGGGNDLLISRPLDTSVHRRFYRIKLK